MTVPTLIPREVIFGNPQRLSPTISPDGQTIAYIAPDQGVLNLWVKTLGEQDDRVITQDRDRGVRVYFWSKDGRYLLYVQDKGGNENWRLYGLHLDSGELKDYTPYDNVQTQVLQQDKAFPNELLIGLNLDNPQVHDVYRLNLDTGSLDKIAANPGNIMGWVADANFQVRAAVEAQPDGSMALLFRQTPQDDWETLKAWGMEDTLNSSPSHFSKDGNTLFLLDSSNVNATRLLAYNLQERSEQVLAQDEKYDVSSLIVDPDSYHIQAYAFNRAQEEWTVIDDDIAADWAFLESQHQGDLSLINRDNDNQTWVVQYLFDNAPLGYYVFHRKKRSLEFLFSHQPALREYDLAAMHPVTYEARDGLTVQGYITYPPGLPRENLPMVINVHGGPWWRDTWGYHPEAQWLANRGYVCLQINYRGSTGYGKNFLNAGDREWAGKMHTDLLDGLEWAVEHAGVDRNRVAIYGGSYGGYAALVGATFTPDVFKCAIDMVGPSSLITLIESFPPYWSTMLDNFKKRVGDPDTEPEFLESRSPLFKVDKIKIPMLIAQGANDPRVTVKEAEQIVAAMKEKDIDHEYLLFEDEGHGLAKPENRLRFYAAVEAFLARHLGGRAESTD